MVALLKKRRCCTVVRRYKQNKQCTACLGFTQTAERVNRCRGCKQAAQSICSLKLVFCSCMRLKCFCAQVCFGQLPRWSVHYGLKPYKASLASPRHRGPSGKGEDRMPSDMQQIVSANAGDDICDSTRDGSMHQSRVSAPIQMSLQHHNCV